MSTVEELVLNLYVYQLFCSTDIILFLLSTIVKLISSPKVAKSIIDVKRQFLDAQSKAREKIPILFKYSVAVSTSAVGYPRLADDDSPFAEVPPKRITACSQAECLLV